MRIRRTGTAAGIIFPAILAAVLAIVVSRPAEAVPNPGASEITVAAAADLTDAVNEIAADFEKKSGAHVRLVFGSSGNLFTQIQNGAPYDVFLSADTSYPEKLAAGGYADPAWRKVIPYATGTLALLFPADSPIDWSKRGVNGLLEPSVKRVSMANPAHAPYGRAAEALLRSVHLYDQVASKTVIGENVAQAAQFVESGNAQVGLVSNSLALAVSSKGKFKFLDAPPNYPPINQGMIVLASSRQKGIATQFAQHIIGPDGKKILTKYGFSVPSGAASSSVRKPR